MINGDHESRTRRESTRPLERWRQPFVEREMKAQHAQLWLEQVQAAVADTQTHLFAGKSGPQWDAASLLSVMWNQWNLVFRKTLGQAERTLVSESETFVIGGPTRSHLLVMTLIARSIRPVAYYRRFRLHRRKKSRRSRWDSPCPL